MLAIPVLAGSSSYAVSESFNWKEGLYRKLKDAYAFYGVIIIAMILGIGLNFVGIDPMKMLIYAAVTNGIVAPFILTSIVLLASNKKVMGQWANAKWVTAVGWLTTTLMTLAGFGVILSLFF
jgi:Mn2+/Fe2+ NRAMP family transporter